MRRSPPRLALWLLERLPSAWHDPLVGDLMQDFNDRAEHGEGLAARAAFWRETLVALWHFRIERGRPAPREVARDAQVVVFAADLRLAIRGLRRDPTFAALSIGTLAIAIGATTAIFSIVNPLIIQPLPYPRASELVMLYERGTDGSPSLNGYASFVDLARASRTLARSAAIALWTPVVGGREPEHLMGARVSAGYFATLGVEPVIGRDFTADDDRPGHNQVVVLSDGLWRRSFGADPHIVGRPIVVNGLPVTVVGVMPASFDDVVWPRTELWKPLGYDVTVPMACRTCRHLHVIARMQPHVNVRTALAELNTISSRMVADHPNDYAGAGMLVEPLKESVMHDYRAVLLAIAGAVLTVLLIASANVANLQLARSVRRQPEFGVRVALGAGRAALARQLLAEALLLALMGGAGGIAIAWLMLPALVSRLPSTIPRLSAIHLDMSAFEVAALTMLAIAVLVGLAPLAGAARVTAFDGLRSGHASGRVVQRRRQAGLVVGEFALALILLFSAGLIGRSLARLMAVEMGFDPGHMLTLQLSAAGPAYDKDDNLRSYHDRVAAAVRTIPGVAHAAVASQIPLGGNLDRFSVETRDRPLANPQLAPDGDRYTVTSDFMPTMSIGLIRGRTFEPTDFVDSAAKVTLVSRTLAGELWPGGEPIGKQIRVGGPDTPWRTVIGVVGDIRNSSLDVQGPGQFYVPERQWPWAENDVWLVVRTIGSPAAEAAAVRKTIAAIDPTVPISRIETMKQVAAASAAQRRLAMLLFGAFATVALILAIGGIYGLLAGSVAERRREIGVRSALGAEPGQILAMVLAEGFQLAAIGSTLGIVGAFTVMRFLRSLLFEIRPMDPVTLTGVGAVLTIITLLACSVPARRALRISPVTALRGD